MVISCTLSAYFLTCAFRACSAVEFQGIYKVPYSPVRSSFSFSAFFHSRNAPSSTPCVYESACCILTKPPAPFERVCITFGIPMFIWAVRESSSLLTYSVLGLSILLDFYYAIHRISVIYGA